MKTTYNDIFKLSSKEPVGIKVHSKAQWTKVLKEAFKRNIYWGDGNKELFLNKISNNEHYLDFRRWDESSSVTISCATNIYDYEHISHAHRFDFNSIYKEEEIE